MSALGELTRPDASGTRSAERRLRATLRWNAATSVVAGLIALVAPGPVARLLGVDGQVAIVRAIGTGLLVFAAAVLVVAAADRPELRRGAVLVSSADATWVIGTAGLVALASFSGVGTAIMVAMALTVVVFLELQVTSVRRL